MNKISRREIQRYFHTLSLAVKILEGHNTIIDLLDDSYIVGEIKYVDGFMNIEVINAVWCDGGEIEHGFDNIFVKNRNIRFVHIPETVSVTEELHRSLQQMRRGPNKPVKRRNFKTSRAMRYTQQTIREAYNK